MIVFDTNAILDLYNYSAQTRGEIIDCLKEKENCIFLPYQVYDEFCRHYHERRNLLISELNKKKDKFIEIFDKLNKKSEDIARSFRRYETTIEIDNAEFTKKVNKLVEKHNNLINQKIESIISDKLEKIDDGNDVVLEFVKNLYNEQKPKDFNLSEKIKYSLEAKGRFSFGFGPGKTDQNKAEEKLPFAPYGDFFLWKQVLNKLKMDQNDLKFVTNEVKIDWWEDDQGKKPSRILIDDFAEVCPNEDFSMCNLDDFLKEIVSDEDALVEIEKYGHIVGLLKDYKDKNVLFSDYIESKLHEYLSDRLEDKLIGMSVLHGSIDSTDNDCDFDLIETEIVKPEYDQSECAFSCKLKFKYQGKENAWISYYKESGDRGILDYIIEGSAILNFIVSLQDIELSKIGALFDFNYFDVEDFDISITDAEILPYEDYCEAENYCPDCGTPMDENNDGGNGFCIKCANDH